MYYAVPWGKSLIQSPVESSNRIQWGRGHKFLYVYLQKNIAKKRRSKKISRKPWNYVFSSEKDAFNEFLTYDIHTHIYI